jgi:hypothetical protein
MLYFVIMMLRMVQQKLESTRMQIATRKNPDTLIYDYEKDGNVEKLPNITTMDVTREKTIDLNREDPKRVIRRRA